MVVCKYYRQGNCRFGQYCQYEHINNFAPTNKVQSYNEDEFAAIVIAKKVLIAERGKHWLLSCFSPFGDKICVPGMEDVSPDELRWEMYEAQKNGMVEQAKLHYQQLCQDMKAKRDALKNPTRETYALMKKLVAASQKARLETAENVAGKSSNFSFAAPQLGLPNSTSASNVFGNKTFGTQSTPFGGGFASPSNTSVFGRTNNVTNPVFGGNPSFGSNLGAFGSTPNTGSVFGGSQNTTQFTKPQPFGAIGTQSSTIFGGAAAQPAFGQQSVFGGSSQVNNVFARPQATQPTTSVFNSGSTASPSLFSGPITSQSSTSIFGGTKTSTANPFGTTAAALQNTNSVFGTAVTAGNFNSGIFSQTSKPAFGGAPVFGGGANFSNAPTPIFGEQAAFGGSTIPNNIFGGSNNTAPTFSSVGQSATNTFAATVPTSSNIFGTSQSTEHMPPPNATPFGTVTPTTSTLFGTAAPTTSAPFVTAASQFDGTNTTASPFARQPFGLNTGQTFGTTVTSSASLFGVVNTGTTFGSSNTTTSPFTTSTFGEVKASPFAPVNTTTTTTTTNPFAPTTNPTGSPFGNPLQTQGSNTATVSSNGPFGKSPFGNTVMTAIIDDSIYSIDEALTDDEKAMYLADKFSFGKIPLKPPLKAIR